PARGVRRPLHHPLDQRGGVPLHPRPRDVGAARADRRVVRRAVPLPPGVRDPVRSGVRRAERTHIARAEGGTLVTMTDVGERTEPTAGPAEVDARKPRRSRGGRRVLDLVGPVLVFGAFIGLWYWLS